MLRYRAEVALRVVGTECRPGQLLPVSIELPREQLLREIRLGRLTPVNELQDGRLAPVEWAASRDLGKFKMGDVVKGAKSLSVFSRLVRSGALVPVLTECTPATAAKKKRVPT